jgi:hypothetical protein
LSFRRKPGWGFIYWMPFWLQTIPGLHPTGVLRTTRFVPDEADNGMTTKTLIQCFLSLIILLGLWFTSAHADDKSMRDELNAMQKKIHAEEETTQKLKEDLAARDKR